MNERGVGVKSLGQVAARIARLLSGL